MHVKTARAATGCMWKVLSCCQHDLLLRRDLFPSSNLTYVVSLHVVIILVSDVIYCSFIVIIVMWFIAALLWLFRCDLLQLYCDYCDVIYCSFIVIIVMWFIAALLWLLWCDLLQLYCDYCDVIYCSFIVIILMWFIVALLWLLWCDLL